MYVQIEDRRARKESCCVSVCSLKAVFVDFAR
jgi:hypothetical protein